MYKEPEKKEKKPPKINYDLLPASMKERYAAMGILPKKELPKKPIEVDIQKMKQRKLEKEQPIEKKLESMQIKAAEVKALEKVFLMLCQKKDNFDVKDVDSMLRKLGVGLTKSEVDLMIWEVDENLDGRVSWTEFLNMYKKCTMDKTGLEPKSLYHMVQFLMYLPPNRTNFKITVEVCIINIKDTLELLHVRFGRQYLDDEIRAIFDDEEKTHDGQEKEICFGEYLEKINQRQILQRKQRKQEQKQMFQYQRKEEEEIK